MVSPEMAFGCSIQIVDSGKGVNENGTWEKHKEGTLGFEVG